MEFPIYMQQLLQILEKHKPLLVGGCVRDYLLAVPVRDYDFVVEKITDELLKDITDSGWEIKKTGKNLDIYNVSRRVPTLSEDLYNLTNITEIYHSIEITEMTNGNIKDDAFDRDLTINAIYYNPYTNEVLDPIGYSISDLRNKLIRITREKVLEQDPLRVLRVYRFSKQLGFQIESRTLNKVRNHFELMMKTTSYSRVMQEIEKLCL